VSGGVPQHRPQGFVPVARNWPVVGELPCLIEGPQARQQPSFDVGSYFGFSTGGVGVSNGYNLREKERNEVPMRKLKIPPKPHKAAGKPATRVKEVAKLASSTEKNKRPPKASGIKGG
jgi:hypothetical protein